MRLTVLIFYVCTSITIPNQAILLKFQFPLLINKSNQKHDIFFLHCENLSAVDIAARYCDLLEGTSSKRSVAQHRSNRIIRTEL